ncbi:MAG TPA: hypothetical protein VFH37_01610 [Candidatus Saccharimonadales bacterium]|nr:hypothetical protein [Candidatus Saccharimonadales bacterium]
MPSLGGYELYELDGMEVDITVFQPFVNCDNACMIIEVAAYDFPDRMRDIGDRIEKIALSIKSGFNLPPSAQVAITFIPIKEGHWAVVE